MESSAENATAGDALLAAARAGDASALWRLTESYRPYLRGVVARMLGPQLAAKVDASDVVQQCLLRAFEQFPQFRGDAAEQWYHWVLALVRNQTRKLVRYWHQERRDVRREQSLTAGSTGGPGVAAEGSSPSQRASRRERATRLLAALQQLPHDYREVLYLRNFEDLPYAEVASRMQRSEEAVRKLWERAIRRLREVWRDAS